MAVVHPQIPLISVTSARPWHIGAGADGNPHVGLGQGRRVVDPVTDHAD